MQTYWVCQNLYLNRFWRRIKKLKSVWFLIVPKLGWDILCIIAHHFLLTTVVDDLGARGRHCTVIKLQVRQECHQPAMRVRRLLGHVLLQLQKTALNLQSPTHYRPPVPGPVTSTSAGIEPFTYSYASPTQYMSNQPITYALTPSQDGSGQERQDSIPEAFKAGFPL